MQGHILSTGMVPLYMLCKGHYVITSLFENVIYCGISESRSHGQEISWEVCFKDKDQTFLVSGLLEWVY